jgi:hypothetical protein
MDVQEEASGPRRMRRWRVKGDGVRAMVEALR